jgi:hypothetical protein
METHEAAALLGVSTRRVIQLLAEGRLIGKQLRGGTWLVDGASVSTFELSRTARVWSPTTSWALLEELSGLRATGIPARTLERVRERITACTPDEIVRGVAIRAGTLRFEPDGSIDDLREDLVLTGASADHMIDSDLAPQSDRIAGYLRDGIDYGDWVRDRLLIEDPEGAVTLWIRPGGEVWGEAEYAPAGVIAADLALSSSARERAAGLAAIARMQAAYTG